MRTKTKRRPWKSGPWTAIFLAALLAIPAAAKVPAPPMMNRQVENTSAWLIDAAVDGDRGLVADLWERYGPTIRRAADPLEGPGIGGSSNIGPSALVAWYLATDDAEAGRQVATYCRRQLDGEHGGLGRQEPTSWLYAWPLSAVGAARSRALATGDRGGIDAACRPYLRATTYLYALAAVRAPTPDDAPIPVTVALPGARSPAGSRPTWLSAWLAAALGEPTMPASRSSRTSWAWPGRVAVAIRHDYIDAADRALLAEHVATGGRAADIVAELQRLGAALRWTVTLQRYDGADVVAWATPNTHHSTPPTMGISHAGGRWWSLQIHPSGFRGEGGRSPGRCVAERSGDSIVETCPGFVSRRGSEPSTIDGRIPASAGAPRWTVTIGPGGARLDGFAPIPPATTGPPAPPPPPSTAEKLSPAALSQLEALCTLQVAVAGADAARLCRPERANQVLLWAHSRALCAATETP